VKIFVCYRRNDASDAADRIEAVLRGYVDRRSGAATDVFVDVHKLLPGQKWSDVLRQRVADCEVFLALIGPTWSTLENDKTKQRRLDEKDDPVRTEIRAAIADGKIIVPVLLPDAQLPAADDLPDDIKALVGHEAFDMRRRTFEADVADLALKLGLELKPNPRPFPWPIAALLAVSAVLVVGSQWANVQQWISGDVSPAPGATSASEQVPGTGAAPTPTAPEPTEGIKLIELVFGPDKANPIWVEPRQISEGDVVRIWDWARLAEKDGRADKAAAQAWLQLAPKDAERLPTESRVRDAYHLPTGLAYCRAFSPPDYTKIDVQDSEHKSLVIKATPNGLSWTSYNIVHATVYLAAVPEGQHDQFVAAGVCKSAEQSDLLQQKGTHVCSGTNFFYLNWQVSCVGPQ
jgi:hypothetical protein